MSKNKKKKPYSTAASSPFQKKKEASSSLFSNFLESNNFYLLLLGIVVFTVSVVRWRLSPMPLERDEGEYAYFGHLILQGTAPYQDAYNMKLPGIYYMYAFLMAIFGETHKGIHLGFLFVNAATMVLLFYSLKKIFSPIACVITAGLYGLMAMSNNVLGFAAHATHFAVFFLALGLFFFSKYDENKKPLYAFLFGVMLGLAFLMKQQAVYFILFGGIIFLFLLFLEKPRDLKIIIIRISVFSFAVFIPYLLVLLLMLASGTFEKFWFWTVQYASKYAAGLPWETGKELLKMTFTPIWEEHKWIYIFAIAGMVIILFAKFSVRQKIFAIALVLFGILATTPGFYFRQHYFIVALPGVALLAAIAMDYAGKFVGEKIKVKVVGIALPLVILFFLFSNIFSNGKFYYSTKNPVMLCKAIYGTNPFTESLDIANYIKANSNDTDKIAVLGSEPQIPFYANRKSATGHIYTYGLMEIHDYNLKMQEEMISEIEKSKPLFLVFVNIPFSWLSKPDSPKKIFEWYNKYATENYNLAGLVDIPERGPSSFYWEADAQRQPQNQNTVWIFKRKSK